MNLNKCKRCKRKIAEGRHCPNCKEILFQEMIEKKTNRKLSKIRNTIIYGIGRVKAVAEGHFWCTTHGNCYRCSKAEKDPHKKKKFERYMHHINLGRTVYTELILKRGMGKPDLIVVDKGFIFIEEIVNSEKEGSIIEKKNKYPFPVSVVKV